MATTDLFKVLRNEYKKNAKRDGVEFALPLELFKKIVLGNCYYCDSEPTETTRSDCSEKASTHGIDKKIPREGYAPHNVVTCCHPCNMMKSNRSKDEFLQVVEKINANTRRD